MNIVLIGHGYWGKNIARNLHQLGVLYGICETNFALVSHLKGLYPQALFFSSIEEVVRDNQVHAVCVCTPAATHASIAIAFLNAGKAVFVEKPLALTVAEGRSMLKAATNHQQILMVGHLLEYHPAILALEDLIQSGALGKIQYIYSSRLNLGKFRKEENSLWSFAPHDIAVILRLLGTMPQSVVALGANCLQPEIADTTVTHLSFEKGIKAHIFVSWLHPYKEQRLVVVGSEKMAILDDQQPDGQKLLLVDKGADWIDDMPTPRSGEGIPIDYPTVEPLKAELTHFIDCVKNGEKPLTDGENGLRVLQVLAAAQTSMQADGTRIYLD